MSDKEQLTQVVKLVQKDLKSFEILYNHIINKVYYWCYMVVKDEGVAHDLAQDSMIKLYNKFHLLTNPETFGPWMYALVRNVCYDHLRANKQGSTVSLEAEPFLKEGLEEETMDYLPEESYSLEETKKIMMELIETLPRKQREVIILYYLEEFKIGEIGEILNCNRGIIKARLHSGRTNLETQIKDYQEKHGTKLYSSILLPLLGLIIQDHREIFCEKEGLKFNKTLYQSQHLLENITLKGLFSFTPLTMVGAAISVLLIIGIASFVGLNRDSSTGPDSPVPSTVAFDKSTQDSPVETVTYNTFPTRKETQVRILLKKEISDERIKISFDGKTIPFTHKEKEIEVKATENGEYTLKIAKKKVDFTVDQINEAAPELLEIQNRGTYLDLVIQDELGQVNYSQSYMEYKGENYSITENRKVMGKFKGYVVVYLYNDAGQYAYYEVNLK